MAKKNTRRKARKMLPLTGLVAVGTGIGVYYANRKAAEEFESVRDKWWLAPGAAIAAGLGALYMRKNPMRPQGAVLTGAGLGLVGAGGVAGAQAYEATAASRATETSGLVHPDTAGLVGRHEALPSGLPYDDHEPPPAAAPPAETGATGRRHAGYHLSAV